MYSCDDAGKQITTCSNFRQLERDSVSVANDPCTDFEQPGLQAGQQPVGHLLGTVRTLQEDAEIVGHRMKQTNFLTLLGTYQASEGA